MALKRLMSWSYFESGQLKYLAPQRKFFITLRFNTNSEVNVEPKTAYLRKENDNAHFTVSIAVEYSPLGLNKVMNFRRELDSPLMLLLQRINCKVYSHLDKIKHKKKCYVDVEVPQVNALLYLNNKVLPDDTICSDIFTLEGKLMFNILSESYEVRRNIPWINNLTLPKTVKSDMMLHPLKFEAIHTDVELSSFYWYRSAPHLTKSNTFVTHIKEWVPIVDSYFYQVTEEDVGHFLKLCCCPRNGEQSGPIFTEFVLNPVEQANCNYYFKNTHMLTKEIPDDSQIRFVSYNILAAMYTNTKEAKELFDYCPASAMDKNQRFPAIARELIGYNADLICLQEVEAYNFQHYILPQFKNRTHIGVIALKHVDKEGTACIINQGKFKFLGSQTYVFGQEVSANPLLKGIFSYMKQNDEFYQKFISLPHCLQMVAVKSNAKPDEVIIIGNVHLYSAPDADLTRLLQALITFRLFETFVNSMKPVLIDCKTTFILCGDFNSTPDSSIHDCVMNGSISADHNIWESSEMKGFKGLSFELPYKMDSACGTPEFTNYTKTFKGCLDYIYYEPDKLQIDKIFPMPSEAVLRENVALPSVCFPSDHLPLLVDMKWK